LCKKLECGIAKNEWKEIEGLTSYGCSSQWDSAVHRNTVMQNVFRKMMSTVWICISCPWVFAAEFQLIIMALGCEQPRILTINQRFDKHYSCHLQGEYVMERVLNAFYNAGSRLRASSVGSKDFCIRSQNLFQRNLG
jgi:hypothetical protein